jgi:two-component system, OmpR family, sensor histidine kinase BaeS
VNGEGGDHGRPPWMRGSGRRPPWWPKEQPWPPQRREDWQRIRRRFARRIGCAVAALLLVLGAAGTAFVWLVLTVLGVIGSVPFARAGSGVGLLLAIGAALLAVALVRRLAIPGGRLVEAARRIESGDYSARVPVRGPGELRAVARAINSMSARLEADEVQRRSVLTDVAHELRTPLTIIRGQAEGIADGVYPAEPEQMAPILAATRTLEKLVDDLRTFALAEAGSLRLAREQVDVAVLLHETAETFRPLAAAAGVALVEDAAADTPSVEGDSARLSGVVANLVSNALRHTARGGTVRIAARAGEAGGVEVTVADDGEGIPPDLLPRVFERFVKGKDSPGTGLGLAIVRDVVEAHGGAVAVDSAVGAGTAVQVTLPARLPGR